MARDFPRLQGNLKKNVHVSISITKTSTDLSVNCMNSNHDDEYVYYIIVGHFLIIQIICIVLMYIIFNLFILLYHHRFENGVGRRKKTQHIYVIEFNHLSMILQLYDIFIICRKIVLFSVRNSNSVLRKHNLPVNPQEHVTNESYFN